VKRTWKTALKNAGIRHVRFHDLRHTFNTRLMEAGVLQEIRMALMGHSSGSKVHSIYTHIELPAKRIAIRKLEQWVKEQPQKQMKRNQMPIQKPNEPKPASSPATGTKPERQTLEKEVARRGGSGASRQAESGDRRDGGGNQKQAQTTGQVEEARKLFEGM